MKLNLHHVRNSGHATQGFTLVELAVVLVLVGLLVGIAVVPLAAQWDAQRREESRIRLDTATEALQGYAILYGYLPCPAVSAQNGNEDRPAANAPCNKHFGFLPWTTLALSDGNDAWGRLLTYSVSSGYSDVRFTLDVKETGGRITILTRDVAGNLVRQSNKDDIPAILLSHGKNGCYATQADAAGVTVQAACAAGSVDEAVNAGQHVLAKGSSTWNNNGPYDQPGRVFVTREAGQAGAGGEFDDMVRWLSPFVLFHRMVSAGRLP